MISSQSDKNIQRIFSLVPLIYNNQGIEFSSLQKMASFTTELELERALEQLTMFGIPPFSPSDFVSLYVDEKKCVYLDFPLGLERPLSLSAAEWTIIQKLIREHLKFIPKNSPASENMKGLIERFTHVAVFFDNSSETSLQRSLIQEALQDSLKIEFLYRSLSSSEAEIRTVDPWLLFENKGMSYLIAYCNTRGATRCFLLERMQNIELLDVKQDNDPSQDLTIYLNELSLFQKGVKGFTIRLAFIADLLANLRLLFPLGKVTSCKKRKGWLQASCKVQDSIWIRSVLRGFGADVILLEPAHLRERYKNELKEIVVPKLFE